MKNTNYFQIYIKKITLSISLLFCLMSLGCADPVTTIINQSIKQSGERDNQRVNSLLDDQIHMINKLRSENNSLGDYLWVRANEDKLVPNPITDIESLKKMYEATAAKGSVDAKIKLSLMKFRKGSTESLNFGGTLEMRDKNKPIWQDALKQLETATKNQCFTYETYIFAPYGKRCLTPKIAADEIWPKFRDGSSYPKDNLMRDYWYEKALSCEASVNYKNAYALCSVYGRSGQRKKEF